MLFRACKTAFLLNVRFVKVNLSPGSQSSVLPNPHGGQRTCRRQAFEDAPGDDFTYDCSRCDCTVSVQALCDNLEPKVRPQTRHGAQKVPQKKSKSYFFEPLCVALGRRCEKICTLREPHYLLCFSLILRVLARLLSPSKWTRGCNVHQKFFLHSFFAILGAHVTPKVAPRQAPGLAKEPPGP